MPVVSAIKAMARPRAEVTTFSQSENTDVVLDGA